MQGLQIAIDGPAGAGKSTVAKRVANALQFKYIDTGAMYRAITLKALRLNIDLGDESAYQFIQETTFKLDHDRLWMDGEDVSSAIRSAEVTQAVSEVSSLMTVREKLVELQQRLAAQDKVVMDGRDIGTNVLKDATKKFYLTASIEERAKRRYLEYQSLGIDCDLESIEKDIERRDKYDSSRSLHPLKPAEDAIIIDTSNLTLNEVINIILENIGEVEEHGI
jgi:cytidylate kinase